MREYRVWTKEEEQALRQGVAKHGSGSWEQIRTDPEFNAMLQGRSGIQLKDKWRNLIKFNHLSSDEINCGPRHRQQVRISQRQTHGKPPHLCAPYTSPDSVLNPEPMRPVIQESENDSVPRKSVGGAEITTGLARSRKRGSHTTNTTSTSQPYAQTTVTHNVASKDSCEKNNTKISREQALLEHVQQLTNGSNQANGAESNCDVAATPSAHDRAESEKPCTLLGTRSRASFDAEVAQDAVEANIISEAGMAGVHDEQGQESPARKRFQEIIMDDLQGHAPLANGRVGSSERDAATVLTQLKVEPAVLNNLQHSHPGAPPGPTPITTGSQDQGHPFAYTPHAQQAHVTAQHAAAQQNQISRALSQGVLAECAAAIIAGHRYPPASHHVTTFQHASPAATPHTMPAGNPATTTTCATPGNNPPSPLKSSNPSGAHLPAVAVAATAANALTPTKAIPKAAMAVEDSEVTIPAVTPRTRNNAAGSPIPNTSTPPLHRSPFNPTSSPGNEFQQMRVPGSASPWATEENLNMQGKDAAVLYNAFPCPEAYDTTIGSRKQHSPDAADDTMATSQVPENNFITGPRCASERQSVELREGAASYGAKVNVLVASCTPDETRLRLPVMPPGSTRHMPQSAAAAVDACAAANVERAKELEQYIMRAGQLRVVACERDQEERSYLNRDVHASPATKSAAVAGNIPPNEGGVRTASAVACAGNEGRDVQEHADGVEGHPAAVSCAAITDLAASQREAAAAAEDTCMEASCIETSMHEPIPAHVLEKVQGIMARHKYSVLRVLPGGQAQLLAELAKGKQFVYFSPAEVEQMIVVEKTRSDSE